MTLYQNDFTLGENYDRIDRLRSTRMLQLDKVMENFEKRCCLKSRVWVVREVIG